MITIKYSQDKIKFTPAKIIKKKKKKKQRIEVKTRVDNHLKPKELKIINILFGDKYSKNGKLNYIYRDVKTALERNSLSSNFHFVLGEHNRDFLLDNGVHKKKIFYIPYLPIDLRHRGSSLFSKTFLMNVAADKLGDNVLFLDYDCSQIVEIYQKDLFSRLKEETIERDFLVPPVEYRNSHFCSIDGKRQNYGLQTCLIYWNNPEIIKFWYKTHLENTDLHSDSDEIAFLFAMEKKYGKLSINDLFDFDTSIIRTRRRPRSSFRFDAKNYENACFKHR